MGVGRVLGTATAAVTVAACAAVVIGMARSNAAKQDALDAASARYDLATAAPARSIPAQLPRPTTHTPETVPTSSRATAPGTTRAGATSVAASSTSPSIAPRTSTAATRPASTPTRTSSAPRATARTTPRPAARTSTKARPSATPAPTVAPRPKATPKPVTRVTPVHHAAPKKGVRLPVRFATGSATRVITVKAAHTWSTTATLQAWTKAPGGGWLRHGTSVTAHLGSQGMSSSPSESKSATPIGSYTLTRAFGHYGNPGTSLPYVHTTPSDWWISQSGPLYNTLQRCSSGCAFTRGSPNEHLYYETPYYNYAVVIDYNTRNTGHVRQGAGSAFFLHVTDGGPTAGCVSIPQDRLISLMRWLTPSAHPRILIGTS